MAPWAPEESKMLYRRVPRTGDELSVLGFGCMRLPEKKGHVHTERATGLLRRAIDRGVNYVDTAMPYHMGESEPFVGSALANGYRDKVKLATKLPPWLVRKSGDMEPILSTQLKNLRTDRIDYYLLHSLARPSWDTLKSLGVLDFLDRARRDGKIVNRGFSFHGDPDTFREIVDANDWEFCMIQYNFLDVDAQAGRAGLEYAASKGLAVMVMEPLRGGSLAGTVPSGVQEVWDRAKVRRTAAEWALKWVWNHPEVTLLLSGMNDENHLEENLRIAGESAPNCLSSDETALVDEARGIYRRLMKASCTGCRYCMPCPVGVDIPTCFDAWNNMHLFGDKKAASFLYTIRCGGVAGGLPGLASQCIKCGKCSPKCPQGLDIPTLLNGVKGDLEGLMTKPMAMGIKAFMALQRLWTVMKGRR